MGAFALADGWYLPAAAADVLRIADADRRVEAFEAAARRLQRCWAIDHDTLIWLMQSAAQLRRLRERGSTP